MPVAHSLDLYAALMEKYPTASVYLDIFDGGHQIDMKTAEYWLLSQYRNHTITDVTG